MKTIIEMAHEAGGILLSDSEIFGLGFEFEIYQLEAFAELVRADEREQCAKVCEAEAAIQKESAKFCKVSNIEQRDFDICAAAIRARSKA